MTAKEKQSEFIKSYLKPILKQNGYQTSGQTWWKNRGTFFLILNLQNYSWNNKDSVDFCFNIGIGLKVTCKDPEKKKVTCSDLTVYLREDSYLSIDRQGHSFRNKTGYFIKTESDLNHFIKELRHDFEIEILPRLHHLKTLKDCLDFYGDITFWGDNLKRVIKENNILLN